ncbi:MAG: hypothetical protein H3C62_03930 [Gemmatimonadaceae bacterium]|nr:hypothetical protein [Gemmatimonadaceae bacterium]
MPDGRVIVNDLTWRQLRLFERDLKKSTVLADNTAATGRAYGGQWASLLAYRGDSSLFIDLQSVSMTVLAPDGDVARVMAIPRPNEALFLVGGPFGTPYFDARGYLVHRGPPVRKSAPPTPPSGGAPSLPTWADSVAIYRTSLATKHVDTVAWIRVPTHTSSRLQDPQGRPIGLRVVANPIPIVDVWAAMPNGQVAIVRGADLHIDWIAPTGQRVATRKLPFPWQRLDDDAKQRLADSAKKAFAKRGEASRDAYLANPGIDPAMSDALMRPLGMLTNRGSGRQGMEFIPSVLAAPPLQELPDYRPAFELGAALPDAEGNLWLRTTMPTDKGAICYVINAKGELIDRVQLPFGRVISGFGKGVVYMGVLDDKGARLEVAPVR